MSLSDVESALNFWSNGDDPGHSEFGPQKLYNDYLNINQAILAPWNSADIGPITDLIRDLYNNSDTAKAILERGAAATKLDPVTQQSVSLDIVLFNRSNGSGSRRETNSISYDIDQVQTRGYIGFDGYIKEFKNQPERVLIHELIHAIDGLHDLVEPVPGPAVFPYSDSDAREYNHPDFNHLGETVELTNQIMVEMGYAVGDGRSAYDATFKLGDQFNPYGSLNPALDYAPYTDIDFTYGDTPGDNQHPDNLDTSKRTDDSDDLLFGFDGEDHIRSGAGWDHLYGGVENDTLYGGSGTDLLHGGDRKTPLADDGKEDTADYSEGDMGDPTEHGVTVRFDLNSGNELDGIKPIVVSDDGYGDFDYLHSIEKIVGTSMDDTVEVNGGDEVFDGSNYALSEGKLEIDAKEGELDTLDFTSFSDSLRTEQDNGHAKVGDVTFKNFEIIRDNDSGGKIGGGTLLDVSGVPTTIKEAAADQYYSLDGVKEIYGNGGDDALVIGSEGRLVEGGIGNDFLVAINPGYVSATETSPEERLTLKGDAGNDIILSLGGEKTKIFGGDGDDLIFSSTNQAEVQGGDGADTFLFSGNTLITDAMPEDFIAGYDGSFILKGAVRGENSESPWALGLGHFQYVFNKAGQLLIESQIGNSFYDWGTMFIEAPEVSHLVAQSDRTAGLLVVEVEIEVKQGWEGWSQGLFDFFETFFGFYMKAMTGESYFSGVDPLVLDLDGDGLELTARTSQSPLFDLDGDGFAEQTGWVQSDDGLLVHDINANGEIDDITELFGSPTTSGFDELAVHDLNADGLIDVNDAIFTDLRVWQDLNQNAKVDAGELSTLTEAGIESISLTATASNVHNANNLIAEVGSFTRTDSTTSEISDVKFKINNYDSKWLGDSTVDPTVGAHEKVRLVNSAKLAA